MIHMLPTCHILNYYSASANLLNLTIKYAYSILMMLALNFTVIFEILSSKLDTVDLLDIFICRVLCQ